MRLVLSLVTVLALALTGCAGGTDDTTDTTDAPTTTPTGTDQTSAPDDPDADDGGAEPDETADPDTEDTTDETADDVATDDVATEGDCSAAGMPAGVDTEMLGPEAGATAEFLLDAAVRCDEQLLFTAAEESGTAFSFGSATFGDVFGLPEDPDQDPAPWEALARLLGGTTGVEADGTWTWPAAFATGAGDDAWQELVDSGLYTEAQVDELQSAPDGYLGWRLGIEADGTWLFFTAGD